MLLRHLVSFTINWRSHFKNSKEVTYKTLVRTKIEYAAPICTNLGNVQSAKYLSITITDKHISEISSYATRTLKLVSFITNWRLHFNIFGNPGVIHSVPTAFIMIMNAVGKEWITPRLPKMTLQEFLRNYVI